MPSSLIIATSTRHPTSERGEVDRLTLGKAFTAHSDWKIDQGLLNWRHSHETSVLRHQDAINLAWKLAMVVHGDARTSLLDSYSPERNAVGELVLRNAGTQTDVATLTNPAAQAARNLVARFLLGFHAVQNEMVTTMSETDIAYRKSPLSSGRHAGIRWAPQHYAGSPPGAGASPRFVVYSADTRKAAVLLAKFPNLVEGTARRPPDDALYVVRPDGYVGLSAGADD